MKSITPIYTKDNWTPPNNITFYYPIFRTGLGKISIFAHPIIATFLADDKKLRTTCKRKHKGVKMDFRAS